mgnify:CR=1 FL=1
MVLSRRMDVEHLGRIAIIEPDPVAAEVVVHQAAKLRRTQLCKDAASARRLLEQKVRLTALIIEYALPDEDGMRLLFAFRRAYPRLPILMLTAVTEPKVINRCQLLRAEFVAKPARRPDRHNGEHVEVLHPGSASQVWCVES